MYLIYYNTFNMHILDFQDENYARSAIYNTFSLGS